MPLPAPPTVIPNRSEGPVRNLLCHSTATHIDTGGYTTNNNQPSPPSEARNQNRHKRVAERRHKLAQSLP
jgi:hypothetical protein